ncbi:MAG: hypothetical protein V4541_03230 [Bacteroidota bacterium]
MIENDDDLALTFKAPLKGWHDLIFISSLLLVSLLIAGLFNFKLNPYFPILIVIMGFIIFYVSRYLTSSLTTLKISNGLLVITQNNSLFKIDKILSLPIEELRGYEINQVTRGNNALFLYTNSFNYDKYSLLKISDELAVEAYLAKYLKKIDKNSNPLFGSFLSAFLFALKNSFLFIALSFGIMAGLYFSNTKYQFGISSTLFFIFSLLTGFIMWWFIIRLQAQRKYFRFGAYYWLSACFFYISTLLFYPLLNNWVDTRETIISVNRPDHILSYQNHSLFKINKASVAPNLILLSNANFGLSNRNGTFPVTHHFITPLGGGKQINRQAHYNFWLGQDYMQKIKSSNGPITRKRFIDSFHQAAKDQFIKSLQKPPVFYKITKYNKDIASLLWYSPNATKLVIVLAPHWESVTSYRKAIQKEIATQIAFIIALNLVGCIIVALNR